MLSRYVDYVNRSRLPAALWSEHFGMVHMNASAKPLFTANSIAELEVLAQMSADDCRAMVARVGDYEMTLVPMIESNDGANTVLALQGDQLAQLPVIFHAMFQTPRHFAQIIHVLPQIVLTARPNGEFDYASRRWYDVFGNTNSDVKHALSAAIPRRHTRMFWEGWKRGISENRPFSFETQLETLHGTRWHELRATPLLRGQHLNKWVVTFEDIHEGVETREALALVRKRMQCLAEIGAILIDTRMPAAELTRRSLESSNEVLEGTWIASFDIDGEHEVVTHPAQGKLLARFVAGLPPGSASVTASVLSWGDGSQRSVLVASLAANEDSIGVLAFVSPPDSCSTTAEDADFVKEVAARLTSALRVLRSSNRERVIARTLQIAMLPAALPHEEGLDFDVLYRAASDEALVGGDWYDAFLLPNGRVAFTVGDVAGHGLDAAVIMSQVREVIRIMSDQGLSAGQVMNHVNETIIAREHGLCTAFLGFMDPLTLELEYACAGHVPPELVLRDGKRRSLHYGDLVLGVQLGAYYKTHHEVLPADSALVLYTDGLIEFSRDAIEGEQRLFSVLEKWGANGFVDGAGKIADDTLQGAKPADDIAILVVRLVKLAKMNTSIRGTTHDARRARLAVARTMSSAPLNKQRAHDFVLAMAEAIANAVEHGTASESERVDVSVAWNNEGAHGTVHSDGSWKLQMPSIDRGRGLDIMRALADRVDIECEPGDGTTVHVSMRDPAKVYVITR